MSSDFGIFSEGEARSLVNRFVEAYRLNLIRVKFDEGELELFRKEMRNYELGVNRGLYLYFWLSSSANAFQGNLRDNSR